MMKNLQSFEEFKETNEKNNVDIFNTQKNKVINQNKEYNTETFPKSSKDTDPNYQFVMSNKIPIGDKKSVQKFKSWNSKFWERRKTKRKNKS